MRAIRIFGSIVVVLVSVLVGAVVGVWIAGQVSSCQGQECLGAAYGGLFIGALVGFVVGAVIVTTEHEDRRRPTDSA